MPHFEDADGCEVTPEGGPGRCEFWMRSKQSFLDHVFGGKHVEFICKWTNGPRELALEVD
jgi:hypothetical protein